MQFLSGSPPPFELTFDDVFLVPERSAISSRLDVDLTSPDCSGMKIPLVASNMTAVSGKRMAETISRRGGLAIIPQDVPFAATAEVIAWVKSRDTVYDTALTLETSNTVNEAIALINKRSHGAIIVMSAEHPVGIVTEADCYGVDRFTSLDQVMSSDLVSVNHETPPREAFSLLQGARRRVAPVVAKDGTLLGVVTQKSAIRSTLYSPNLDHQGRLRVGAAIGINADVPSRAQELISAGIDLLVLDTAHGHQDKMLKTLRSIREISPGVALVAGNVATAQGAIDLLLAGADIVKVGIGPGAMCTTRMLTGVGRPQFSAIAETASAAAELGGHVWADGGIRHPRDVSLALAAGASAAMIGSWFVGTHESPGDVHLDPDGRLYKESFGMASTRAVQQRNSKESAFDAAQKLFFEEGISTARMYLDQQRPGVEDIIDYITSGIRSTATYLGASNLEQLHRNARIGIQSAAGYAEGLPLSRSW